MRPDARFIRTRGFARLSLWLFVGWLSIACSAENETALAPGVSVDPASWNVVLITLDTVRADALGAYGQELDTTPSLDRLAEQGVLFEQVVTAAPHTLAAHASIMTGLYPFAHGARGNHGFILSPENETLAEILRDRGHRTRAEISATVLRSGTRIAQGFEDDSRAVPPARESENIPAPRSVAGNLRRSAENISDRGIDFIRTHRDEPFLLWLHYFDAHLPYNPRPTDLERFPDNEYLAQVAALDREVQRVIDAIIEADLRDRTLVVLTSDHGEGLGEHDEPTHSYFVYESTMRVPLLFWGPPILPRNRRIDDVVRTVDILPTVLDWMGIESPAGLHGRSLRGLMEADKHDSSVLAYGEALGLYRIFGTTPLRIMRDGRWKYIHSARPELYDLAVDPGETRNLVDREPEIVARLERRLVELLATAGSAPSDSSVETTSATEAQLLALGYLTPNSNARLDDSTTLARMGPAPGRLAEHADRLSRAKGSIAARKWDRALATLEPVLEAHPKSPTVLSLVGEALAGGGHEERALANFRAALRQDTDPCSDVRLDLARAFERFGREEERLRVLEHAVEACPTSSTYLNEAAWALATTPAIAFRDEEHAVELARQLIAAGDGVPDPNHLDTLAAAHAARGDLSSAYHTQLRALRILERAAAAARQIAAYRETLETYRTQRDLGKSGD